MIKVTWTEVSQRYGMPVHHAKVGRIVVGTAGWNSNKSKDEEGVDYAHLLNLPGLTDAGKHGKHPTLEQAKAVAERVIQKWFAATGVDDEQTSPA